MRTATTNTFPRSTRSKPNSRDGVQITLSPYYGAPDFSALAGCGRQRIDRVSVADLLRNAFVYPPHSICEDVKVVTFGFSPRQDMRSEPRFRFQFRQAGEIPEVANASKDWLGSYHRMLCKAVRRSCAGMARPWLLQSGGKDSTTLAIALAETRPDATCITYLGGPEESEAASAREVAHTLGMKHEVLTCNPGRAYDRYLALIDRLPLLTADFALLAYLDVATEIAADGGDGVIDGLGSDNYFGTPMDFQQRWLARLAREWRLPLDATGLPLVGRSFELCFVLATLQMNAIERVFPGSRFNDAEVDALFGEAMACRSRARLMVFSEEIASATSSWEWRDMSMSIAGSAGSFAKGLFSTHALSLRAAYPFCDRNLREWIHHQVPRQQKIDPDTLLNKVLVRRHIATRFQQLPYVRMKGSFRFDLCGLAARRFDQVREFALQARDELPGAVRWLDQNRGRMHNKYHASRFYLLAVILPWLVLRGRARAHARLRAAA